MKRKVIGLNAGYALRRTIGRGRLPELVNRIRDDYEWCFGQPLQISANSLAMEIAGHVHAYRFSLFLRQMISCKLIRKFSYHVCKIDCGEKGFDWNREIWDMTGLFAPLFFRAKKSKLRSDKK